MPRFIDLVGQRFSRLTVGSLVEMTSQGARWLCRCECGAEVIVSRGNLATGNTKSCGCLRRDVSSERSLTHGATQGATRTPEYEIWASMIQRCRNSKAKAFSNYGGRGISVCARWSDFENFIADMGPRPSPEHSIERDENDGHYEPGNCRWATRPEQARNKRNNRRIETPAGSMLLADAAAYANIPTSVLWKRLHRGWSTEQLFLPLGTYTKTRRGEAISSS